MGAAQEPTRYHTDSDVRKGLSPVALRARLAAPSVTRSQHASKYRQVLLRMLIHDPSRHFALEAARFLTFDRSPEVVRKLSSIKGLMPWWRRSALAYALRGRQDGASLGLLRRLAYDKDARVRAAAFESMGSIRVSKPEVQRYLLERFRKSTVLEAKAILSSLRRLKYTNPIAELGILRRLNPSSAVRMLVDEQIIIAARVGKLY